MIIQKYKLSSQTSKLKKVFLLVEALGAFHSIYGHF